MVDGEERARPKCACMAGECKNLRSPAIRQHIAPSQRQGGPLRQASPALDPATALDNFLLIEGVCAAERYVIQMDGVNVVE